MLKRKRSSTAAASSPAWAADNLVFPITRILGERRDKADGVQYLVSWAPTWEDKKKPYSDGSYEVDSILGQKAVKAGKKRITKHLINWKPSWIAKDDVGLMAVERWNAANAEEDKDLCATSQSEDKENINESAEDSMNDGLALHSTPPLPSSDTVGLKESKKQSKASRGDPYELSTPVTPTPSATARPASPRHNAKSAHGHVDEARKTVFGRLMGGRKSG